MHVHLPKPLHGWRAFVGEVGIIVLGVLIALGAGELAQAVHQRSEAHDAEREIRGELELDMAKLRDRARERACVDRRIAEVQALIDSADREGGKIATPSWVSRPQFWTMQLSRWQAVSQGGKAALIPGDELALYGAMYAYMTNVNGEMAEEQSNWARLRSLERLHRLTPEMAFTLTSTLQEARYINWRINVWTTQLQRQFTLLHLKVVPNDVQPATGVCLAISTSREQALRESHSPFGEP